MKNRILPSFLWGLAMVLGACSPFTITSSSGQQPTPIIETEPSSGYQPVQIDHVQAEVGVGSPIPVQVTVSGNLPDTCAQIELMQMKQEGSSFNIALSTIPSNAEGCVQDTLPFRIMIPLNVVNLPAGPYSVDVNGSRADFKLGTVNTTSSQPTVDSSSDLVGFESKLQTAITQRDGPAMRSLSR